jgi:hypothetical protein
VGVQDGGRLGVPRIPLGDGRGDGRSAGYGRDAGPGAGNARRDEHAAPAPSGTGVASRTQSCHSSGHRAGSGQGNGQERHAVSSRGFRGTRRLFFAPGRRNRKMSTRLPIPSLFTFICLWNLHA